MKAGAGNSNDNLSTSSKLQPTMYVHDASEKIIKASQSPEGRRNNDEKDPSQNIRQDTSISSEIAISRVASGSLKIYTTTGCIRISQNRNPG